MPIGRDRLEASELAAKKIGMLALIGGGEWEPPCAPLDKELLAASGAAEVVVLPTAAAFEHPERAAERAKPYFEELGATVVALDVLNRRDAELEANVRAVQSASFVYFADGSPLHLRSAIKGSALYDALLRAYQSGAVIAASGAGATVLCDPMVDPRGGAYTVGLGIVRNLAIFPYHGTAADHLRDRSIDLLPSNAVLAGLDEHTALVRDPSGAWRAAGPGEVTLYRVGAEPEVVHDAPVAGLDV
jgi:cyanophycinase